MAKSEVKACLVDPSQPAVCRGLSQNAYQYCLARVKKGEVTWEQLEEAGLAAPPTRKASVNPMAARYAAAFDGPGQSAHDDGGLPWQQEA
uniref:Uncharacterized protein n=1 Tax=viral metagenome TaxID=1070528 RepID=A0A6M3JGQ9_9ZZZZ